MAHIVDQAAVVPVRHGAVGGGLGYRGAGVAHDLVGGADVPGTLVGQREGQALVEEGHLLKAGTERLEVVDGRLEYHVAGPERHGGAGAVGRLVPGQRGQRHPVGEPLPPHVALPADLDLERRAEGVDDRDADPVQSAGDRVAGAAELSAGVQHGQHDLDGRLPFAGDDPDGDAAPVVDDAHPAVGAEGHLDVVAVAREGLVDGIVDDLVDEVVQAALAGRADVHARALANSLEPLEDRDRAGVVATVSRCAGAVDGDLVGHGRGCSSSSRTRGWTEPVGRITPVC